MTKQTFFITVYIVNLGQKALKYIHIVFQHWLTWASLPVVKVLSWTQLGTIKWIQTTIDSMLSHTVPELSE